MTRGEHLLYLLNDIDDDLIDAASHGHAPAERAPAQKHLRRWAALAACLLLVVGVWRLFPRMGSSEAPEQTAPGTMDPGSANPGEAPPLTSEPSASFDPNYGAPGEIAFQKCLVAQSGVFLNFFRIRCKINTIFG